jgi:hypothetical protein
MPYNRILREDAMETCDRRIARARQFLADARKRDPAGLRPEDLAREDAELRRCLGWAIDVVDDFADTALNEDEPSQVMLWGGLYIAPADVRHMCAGCLGLVPADQPRRAAG